MKNIFILLMLTLSPWHQFANNPADLLPTTECRGYFLVEPEGKALIVVENILSGEVPSWDAVKPFQVAIYDVDDRSLAFSTSA